MIDAALSESAALLGGLWWLTVPGWFVVSLLASASTMGLATVAAIDYRLRAEGTDLHAALEMPVPA
jgi:hypothetical protein